MKTTIYIDGFNLYYGALKGSEYKWLDLNVLFREILKPHHQITCIKYYTANVSPRNGDLDAPVRQQVYLNALRAHIPHIEVHHGHFLTSTVKMRLAIPIDGEKYADVIKTEEKGSDVNLALHVLNDAWKDSYECAVIVSNDSDLAEALRLVKSQLKKKIVLVPPGNPKIRPPSNKKKT